MNIDYEKVKLQLTLKGLTVTSSTCMISRPRHKYLELKTDMWYAQIERIDRKICDEVYTAVKGVYFKNFYAESIMSPTHAERLVLEKWVKQNERLRKN